MYYMCNLLYYNMLHHSIQCYIVYYVYYHLVYYRWYRSATQMSSRIVMVMPNPQIKNPERRCSTQAGSNGSQALRSTRFLYIKSSRFRSELAKSRNHGLSRTRNAARKVKAPEQGPFSRLTFCGKRRVSRRAASWQLVFMVSKDCHCEHRSRGDAQRACRGQT